MRALDALESSLFIDRHPGLLEEIHIIDNRGMFSEYTGDLAFPWGDGRSILDPVLGGYVLVWRDASERWHYIDMSDTPAVAAVMNNAPFHSVDESFLNNVLDETYSRAGQLGAGLGDAAQMLPWVIGGLVVLEAFRTFKR